MRGLPGVGKTTFAQTCFPERTLFEADLFAEGSRNFAERHACCQRALHDHLQSTDDGAIVCNTFTTHGELLTYFAMLPTWTQSGLIVPVVFHLHPGDLTHRDLAHRTRHHVPELTIYGMRQRWEAWPGEITVGYGGASTP